MFWVSRSPTEEVRAVKYAGDGALAGVKVLDLSRILAGPYCTQMLADHGAEVIKVEPPAGDDTRTWGPPFVAQDSSAYFVGLNRNKKNICLDLRSRPGQEVLGLLLSEADVLVENFKPGTLAKWGFSDEHLAARHPSLIHCRITGFGVDGPLGNLPGYDAILQAHSGLMSINGEADRAPLRVGVPIVDLTTGIYAFSGILLALRARADSGRGQLVDCTLHDTALSLLHPHSATWLASGANPARTGSAHPTIAPYDSFATSTGPLFIAVGNDGQFESLCEVLGSPEMARDARFRSNSDRVEHRPALSSMLDSLTLAWERDGLCEALLEAGVPSGPVHSVGEAMTSAHAHHRQMIVETDSYRGVGIPIKLSRTPGAVRHGPRERGQDIRAVARDLGLSPGLAQYLQEVASADVTRHREI